MLIIGDCQKSLQGIFTHVSVMLTKQDVIFIVIGVFLCQSVRL